MSEKFFFSFLNFENKDAQIWKSVKNLVTWIEWVFKSWMAAMMMRGSQGIGGQQIVGITVPNLKNKEKW